jgi:hypothetical protein
VYLNVVFTHLQNELLTMLHALWLSSFTLLITQMLYQDTEYYVYMSNLSVAGLSFVYDMPVMQVDLHFLNNFIYLLLLLFALTVHTTQYLNLY